MPAMELDQGSRVQSNAAVTPARDTHPSVDWLAIALITLFRYFAVGEM